MRSWLKRALDVLLALVGMLLLLPLWFMITIAIWIDDPGPIIYSQTRIGRERRQGRRFRGRPPERRRKPAFGRQFTIYKFRSMKCLAEQRTGPVWARKGDDRVTRVGRVLRRLHIDETAQMLNVLRGEMSIVGPRPERPEIVQRLVDEIPGYAARCMTTPGLTGLAQVLHCYDRDLNTAARKLRYDLYYIRHGGLLMDLKIMVATLPAVIATETH